MTAIKRFIVAAVLVFGVLTDQAQSESAVQSTAEANGLTAAGPTPIGSTFMTVIWTGAVLPYPFLPPGTDLPVYTLDASNSVYLVDDTATTNTITAAELTAQTNAVLALIAEYQPPPPVESRGARADLDYSPLSPVGANGSYTLTNDGAFQPNTNEVWLAITNVIISEQLASLNLYVPTNVIISGTTNIYAIWTTTNLAAGWQVAAEVWLPYPAPATNPVVVPFTLPIWQSLEMPAASPALFFKAQAWTDWTISGNVAPVWWTFEFFALTNVSDLSADCDGHTLRYDYTNNLPPAEPPIITEDPGNEMVLAGDAVFLDAALAAPGIYASQWFFNGAPVMSNLITTVAGGGENAPSDSGPATNAYISGPQGVAVDRARNIYIADSYDSLVLRVDTNGIITTVAGSLHGAGYSGDGGKATNAILNYPSAVVLDHQGNLYIADQCNNLIRRVGTNGYISTVAGDSIHQTAGYYGDGGTATNACLDNPSGVAVDPAGNLWIADAGNNVVRRVGTNGIITTVAGNYALGANYGGDGYPATNAELSSPSGVAVDASGNLYIADANNNVIRKVAVDGIITTVAGNYYSSALYTNYPGAAATNVTLSLPADVAIDSAGNLYIVDTDDGVIRLVDAEGIISTVAGSNSLNGLGISGDGGPGPDAGLYYPGGAAVDGAGNLYIADTGDSRVRCVTPVNRADQTNEYINLTISSAQTNSTGSYAVVLTDACGSITSSIASVVVGVPPVIIRQPVNQFLLLGDDAVFQVVATAFPAPAYQWYFGSNILAGATNATFSIASFTTNNLGNYHVAVTNYFGAVTSAISTVSAAGNDVGSLNAVEVYAGADETLTNAIFPTTDTSFQLQGVILGASGNTPLGSCVATWSVVSAPAGASVRFVDPNLTNSIVTVANGPSNAGPYRFRLTLADGQSAVSSDVVIMLVQLEPFPYLATNYLYAYSLSNSLTNFFAITNYDGAWSGGQAGFGNYVDQCGPVYSTYWPGYAFYDPYLYIRRPFMVPAGTTNLTLSFAIDNDAQLFLNGTLLTPATNTLFHGLVVTQNVAHVTLGYGGSGFSTRFDTQSTDENTSSPTYGQEVYLTNVFGHGGCSDTNELVLSGLSTNVWHTGSNLLVAMVYDAGVASYFDSQIACLVAVQITNGPLLVYAGENQFVSPVSSKIGLYGVVSDGTLPPSGPLTNVWSELSGPDNNITFYPEETVVDTNFAFADAGATVDMPGTYQFQLIASDAQRRATNVVTVIVDDGSVAPPTVSILSPTNNAAFPFGVIPITATANASTGAIAAVDFYAENSDTGDDLLIGRAINHPYIMDWINPPMGNYFLTAVAIDGAGRIESSEPIQIQINYGIYAGAGQVITNSTPNIGTNSLELQGVVSGVGSNALNGAYTTTWSVVSAPANASGIVFSNANLTNTIATFTGKISSLGTYVLMLTLTTDDGSFAICSDVTNTIVAEDVLPYQAPSYFYAYATNDSFAGFQATNYNDSYWNLGPAAFGNGGGCNLTPVTYPCGLRQRGRLQFNPGHLLAGLQCGQPLALRSPAVHCAAGRHQPELGLDGGKCRPNFY